ncbi:MAG: LD-carboxypeptidase [Bacteroidota bacterium]
MASAAPLPLVYPAPLRPGGRLGVIAPASAPRRPDTLARGLAHLEALGYEIVQPRAQMERQGYLAGSDAQRLDELNALLRRTDLDALVCVRGGYGTLRLLPGIDYEAARAHPKLLIGYSDITALQLALYTRAGLPSLSGPMVAVEWGAMTPAVEADFWAMVTGVPRDPLPLLPGEALVPVRPGSAEGPLLGGNLAVLTRLIGTPYLPPLDGAILVIEEVGEAPYRLDGLFAHLHLSGVLDRIGGLLIGQITAWAASDEAVEGHPDEVIAHYTAGLSCPVARGFAYGHVANKHAVPLGIPARLEVTDEAVAVSYLSPLVHGPAADDHPEAAT